MQIIVSANNDFLHQIPPSFGVYRFYALDHELLYVGKAINLFKRVKSYFQKQASLSPRISLMMQKIAQIEITLTENEASALLLESNLIKELKPKYNVIFRDDKTYPYIRISKHQFPLLESYRGKANLGGELFGPYPNASAVRESLELLQRLFKLRTCSDSVFANRSRPCMLYQINLCAAPCVNYINHEQYAEKLNYAKEFLRGNYPSLVHQLSLHMEAQVKRLEFEQAAVIRDTIQLLRELQQKQVVSDANSVINGDIILIKQDYDKVFIYFILLRNGLYVGDKHFVLEQKIELVIEGFLEEYYQRSTKPEIIYLDFALEPKFEDYFVKKYKVLLKREFKGRVAELVTMGQINLQQVIENNQIKHIYIQAASELAKLLHLTKITRIECYDTSHNHGSSAVAAMSVYSCGKVDNRLYRKFNLSEQVNGDDVLALHQVLSRRLANNEWPLPEVLLIDGGRAQLNSAKKVLQEYGFYDKIKPIAIFKGEQRKPKLDRLILDAVCELRFQDAPQVFRLLQTLRDEAHRFALTGHRQQQTQRMQFSRLEDISGIGTAKRKSLIAFFGSAKNVGTASIAQLQQVNGIGIELATSIYNFFHP